MNYNQPAFYDELNSKYYNLWLNITRHKSFKSLNQLKMINDRVFCFGHGNGNGGNFDNNNELNRVPKTCSHEFNNGI